MQGVGISTHISSHLKGHSRVCCVQLLQASRTVQVHCQVLGVFQLAYETHV